MKRIEIIEVNNGWIIEERTTVPNMQIEVIAVFNEVEDMTKFIGEYFGKAQDSGNPCIPGLLAGGPPTGALLGADGSRDGARIERGKIGS